MELYDKIISMNANNRKNYLWQVFSDKNTTLAQIKYLIDSDLNIDINYVFIATCCCATGNNLDKIIYLINNGANINYNSGSALCFAIECHNKLLIKFFLDNDIVLTDETLKTAITLNCTDIVKYMINTGFKITKEHLEMAVGYERHKIIKILINEGASPNDICEYYFNEIINGDACLTNEMLLVLSNNCTDFNHVINKLNNKIDF